MFGEEDGECAGEPRTMRVIGTIDRPNRTGNDRVTSQKRNANRYCGWGQAPRAHARGESPAVRSAEPLQGFPFFPSLTLSLSLSLFLSRGRRVLTQTRAVCGVFGDGELLRGVRGSDPGLALVREPARSGPLARPLDRAHLPHRRRLTTPLGPAPRLLAAIRPASGRREEHGRREDKERIASRRVRCRQYTRFETCTGAKWPRGCRAR